MSEGRKDDGGPAFPVETHGEGGMSLRDWFAGQSVGAVLASAQRDCSATLLEVAEKSYRLADAMLEARKQ
jgi:hypothetical protein